MRAVADAGPLIHLSWIEQLHLLEEIFEEVLLPEAVRDEVLAAPTGTRGLGHLEHVLTQSRRIRVTHIVTDVRAARSALGTGELEAIVLAEQQRPALLLTDDALGRREATSRAIAVVGTAGVLIEARRQGLLSDVYPLLIDLRRYGQWLSDEVIELVRNDELKG